MRYVVLVVGVILGVWGVGGVEDEFLDVGVVEDGGEVGY